jgi:hypothetical protein
MPPRYDLAHPFATKILKHSRLFLFEIVMVTGKMSNVSPRKLLHHRALANEHREAGLHQNHTFEIHSLSAHHQVQVRHYAVPYERITLLGWSEFADYGHGLANKTPVNSLCMQKGLHFISFYDRKFILCVSVYSIWFWTPSSRRPGLVSAPASS